MPSLSLYKAKFPRSCINMANISSAKKVATRVILAPSIRIAQLQRHLQHIWFILFLKSAENTFPTKDKGLACGTDALVQVDRQICCFDV